MSDTAEPTAASQPLTLCGVNAEEALSAIESMAGPVRDLLRATRRRKFKPLHQHCVGIAAALEQSLNIARLALNERVLFADQVMEKIVAAADAIENRQDSEAAMSSLVEAAELVTASSLRATEAEVPKVRAAAEAIEAAQQN